MRISTLFTPLASAMAVTGLLSTAALADDVSFGYTLHLAQSQEDVQPDTGTEDTPVTPEDEDTVPEGDGETAEEGEGNDPFVHPMPPEEDVDRLELELENAEMSQAQELLADLQENGFAPVAAGFSSNSNYLIFFQNADHDWQVLVLRNGGETATILERGTDLRAASYYAYGRPINFTLTQGRPPQQQPECVPMEEYVKIQGDENGALRPLYSMGASLLTGTIEPGITLNVIYNDSEWEMIRIELGTGYGEEMACPMGRGVNFQIVEPPAPQNDADAVPESQRVPAPNLDL